SDRRGPRPDPAALRGAASRRGRARPALSSRRRKGARGVGPDARSHVRATRVRQAVDRFLVVSSVRQSRGGQLMKGRGLRTLGFVLIVSLIATGFAAAKVQSGGGGARALAASGCQLTGKIKHVVFLDFDNTHYMRDNQSVASDLEQMPNLLNFLTQNGTLFTNDHTILISHT